MPVLSIAQWILHITCSQLIEIKRNKKWMRIPVIILSPGLLAQYLWNPWGQNFACGNYDYRYFLFGLKMTIIVILRSLTHTPTHTLALALTLTLQDDINLLSKGKGFSKGKCVESKFILFILATKKYYFVQCVDLLLEKYRVEFNMRVDTDWCILKRPVTRAVIKSWGPGIFPRLLCTCSGYFHRKIEEK